MKKVKISFIFLCLFFLAGCSVMQDKVKSISDMTTKEKVTMAYSMYNSQFAIYMNDTGWKLGSTGVWEKVSIPVLSDDEKKLLRTKKEILTKMYPLIKIYNNMSLGIIPYSLETETELFKLIDDMALLI